MNKIYFILFSVLSFPITWAQSILFITDTIDTYQSLPITYLMKGLHFRKYTVSVYCVNQLKLRLERNDVLKQMILSEFPSDLSEYSTIICSNIRIAKEYIFLKELQENQNKKFITIVRGDDFTAGECGTNGTLKNLFTFGDLFLVTSQHAGYLLDLCCLAPEKIQNLPLPVDCVKSQFQINVFDSKKEVKILLVDEFSTDSGLEIACKALCMLDGVKFSCTVVCDDKKARKLKSICASPRFHFFKIQSNAQFISLFKQHHILIMTPTTSTRGIRKGIPLSMLEAMAHGVLVIASRHGSIPEVIKNNENGYLVPERDSESLAEVIRLALSEKKTWPSKVLRSREIILERHERIKIMRKLHALLSKNE